MSGDGRRIQLLGLDAPLRALHAVAVGLEAEGRPCAVIGGIAVMARTGTYRATADADALIDAPDDDLATPELLVTAGVAEPAGPDAPQRVLVDGTAVDCIDTLPVDDLDGLTDQQALFVGGHRYAHDTAESVTLAGETTELTVPVATVAGLIPTKLHAALYRRNAEKVASDIADLLRLLTGAPHDTAARFHADATSRGARLRALVVDGITSVLESPASARGKVRRVGVDVSEAVITVTAGEFLDALGRA